MPDSYKSIAEAFIHAGASEEIDVKLKWIYSGDLENGNAEDYLKDLDGILIAPGFGDRGIEGKITAAKYARENKIPLLGICLGMQIITIEFARNVLGFEKANSMEFDDNSPYPVISLMEEQKDVIDKGGTMRLGAWKCELKPNTKIAEIYNAELISERHRHRYEFNNDYIEDYEKKGLIPSGFNPETHLVEVVELKYHPFYVGVQYHPEYKSTVASPHPLFIAFIKASANHKK